MIDYRLSIPVTHCNNDTSTASVAEAVCFHDANMICVDAPDAAGPLNIDYRDRVYLGQFRTIGMHFLPISV